MRLLIIGDLSGEFGSASRIAHKKGASVRQVETIESAMSSIRSGHGADLIMIDVKKDINTLITSLNNEHIFVPVIACGLDNNTEDAVKSIRAGAKEYITLPPNEELIAAILEAITQDTNMLSSKSPVMQDIIKLATQIAPSDANVLITGESGTGKEVISKFIHKKSKRASKPFISVNCAAIPENLIESELFGHEKGAFTGAIAKRVGKFEESNGGTLLLDEISEIDIKLQAKLLRAIQEKEIDRIGGTKPVKLDLRIIATSNRDLLKEVKEGRFREDLYFRLNIINLKLPSLNARGDDIIVFADHFIKKYSESNSLPIKNLSKEAKELIKNYPWPGNVRELENTIYRAVLISTDNEITSKNLMLEKIISDENNINNNFVGKTVEAVEKDLILHTLNHCLGNRTHAANILGISIRTLRNKLNAYTQAGVKIPASCEE
ncbi:MAG: sigma-54-dependent transcriptional regulator [Alphaproteobacteria bacterium]